MGLTGPLPDHILRLMRPEDRPKGNEGLTSDEAIMQAELTSEKKQHYIFKDYCLLKDILPDDHNMAKPTTNRPGWPDFGCYKDGRVLFVEFKTANGRLSKRQEEVKAELERQGFRYCVVHSASEAIDIAKTYLIEKKDE